MNKKIKLIDITLRDGGHKTGFYFDNKTISTVLSSLNNSGIDYAEVGYRSNASEDKGDKNQKGLAGVCSKPYLAYCKSLLSNCKLTVMINPQHIYNNDLEEMSESGVDAINIYFDYEYPFFTLKMIEKLRTYNFELFITLPKISRIDREKLNEHIRNISKAGITNILLEDTNGSLIPSKITELFSSLAFKDNLALGLHARDHLGLAHANSIAAIDAGSSFLSSSLYGLGKYNGNLRTEAICSFLQLRGSNCYDLCELYVAAEYIKDHISLFMDKSMIKNMINASFDLSSDDEIDLNLIEKVKDFFKRGQNFEPNSHKPNHKNKLH
ncbi:2-isopropylmalate synthase [Rickettsiales bacterium Ac37b]|nr:2-isopropylmalate synthase [Rickettsiales bacterium Ac37b]